MASACWVCEKPLGIEELPFTCSYCGGTFCAEHRLPPNHSCRQISKWYATAPLHMPTKKGLTLVSQRGGQAQVEVRRPRRRWVKWAVGLIIFAIVCGAYFILPSLGFSIPTLPITPPSAGPIQTTVGAIIKDPSSYLGKNVTVEGNLGVLLFPLYGKPEKGQYIGDLVCTRTLSDEQGFYIPLLNPLPYEREGRSYSFYAKYRVTGRIVEIEIAETPSMQIKTITVLQPFEMEVIGSIA